MKIGQCDSLQWQQNPLTISKGHPLGCDVPFDSTVVFLIQLSDGFFLNESNDILEFLQDAVDDSILVVKPTFWPTSDQGVWEGTDQHSHYMSHFVAT